MGPRRNQLKRKTAASLVGGGGLPSVAFRASAGGVVHGFTAGADFRLPL